MPDVSTTNFFPMMQICFPALNRAGPRMLRGQSQDSLCLAEPVLGIYKNFLCSYVQD